ncbi:hypothetical protein BOTBODRAFT_172333 [Botryobasidium botryosum FD-172 SS1]|uniref:Integral membrane protein n=1 Tax=Botryobasidium botryosum (strain FD-172 SS1) TaxID=930990 RepID=A0A067MZG7_BOTB1|nr:hypothetical protein BOTBODRAFT_172333 [Botryobasidium botryosum FD-172 SS1]
MSYFETHHGPPDPGRSIVDTNVSTSAQKNYNSGAFSSRGDTRYSRFSTNAKTTTRPLPYVHPTRSQFFTHYDPTDLSSGNAHIGIAQWSSRASRKNRYSSRALHVQYRPRDTKEDEEQDGETSSLLGDRFVEVVQRLYHPSTRLKARLTWDISFWVAVIFIFGTTAWVANSYLLLYARPDKASVAAWCAIAGGILFELGSYLMYVEALNAGHEQLFGPTVWGLAGRDGVEEMICEVETEQAMGKSVQFRWIGFGSSRELGFIACIVQLTTMNIFLIPILMGFLKVVPASSSVTGIGIVYWALQVIGGSGFIIASALFMLEEQYTWWGPAPLSVGWQIGFWNLIGSIGFTLCGIHGYLEHASANVNCWSTFALFWGSWAFMVGSLLQFWETLWREE